MRQILENLPRPNAYHCQWVIEAPKSSVIQITGTLQNKGAIKIYDSPIPTNKILVNRQTPFRSFFKESTDRYVIIELKITGKGGFGKGF